MTSVGKRVNFWMVGAWVVHAVAWFCPVEKHGVRFPHGLPGWEAFTIALSPLWQWSDWHPDNWHWRILNIASALACAAFILGAWWIASRRSAAVRRKIAWWMVGAFLVNSHWLLFGSDLRPGYYLWWASFLLLAIGLFTTSSAKEEPGP